MEEIWRDVAGYEGLYQVSNFGRVKSLKRGKEKILKSSPSSCGYLRVMLCKDDKQKTFLVHRLVAAAFIPNPQGKPQINHLNGVKTDNHESNLEWATRFENIHHAYNTRLFPSGGSCYKSKLTDEDVIYIRNNPDNLSANQLAEKFDIAFQTISEIQLGQKRQAAGGIVRQSKVKRVSDEQRAEVKSLRAQGLTQQVIADMFGVCHATIWNICNED